MHRSSPARRVAALLVVVGAVTAASSPALAAVPKPVKPGVCTPSLGMLSCPTGPSPRP
jgi:hypothetical protein